MDVLLAGLLVLALDQVTKSWIRTRPSMPAWQSSIVRIRKVQTVRSTFCSRRSRVLLSVTWVISLASVWLLFQSGTGLQTEVGRLGAGAALGGAAGNLTDVLRRQAVTDFIDLGWWPVFNLADVGIVAGLLFAFLPLT